MVRQYDHLCRKCRLSRAKGHVRNFSIVLMPLVSLITGTGDMNILNQIRVPVIDTYTCNKRDWYDGLVTSKMVCAGLAAGGQDSCQVR